MRNPRYWKIIQKAFGIKPTIIGTDISFRRGRFYGQAMKRAFRERIGTGSQEDLINVLVIPEVKHLGLAALAHGGDGIGKALPRAVRAVVSAAPSVELRDEARVRSLLEMYASGVRSLRQEETDRLAEILKRYRHKTREMARNEQRVRRCLSMAREAARSVRLSGEALGEAYDAAHGSYSRIPTVNALKAPRSRLDEVTRRIVQFQESRGYRPWKGDPSAKPEDTEIAQAWVEVRNDLIVVEGFLADDLLVEVSRLGIPVLTVSTPAALEKEGWSYQLFDNGREIDRHCPMPHMIVEISEREEEGDGDDYLKGLIAAWLGSSTTLAGAMNVSSEAVDPYLLQLDFDLVEKVWSDQKLFISLKAFEDDRFSLAGPWNFMDLLRRLGGGTAVYEEIKTEPLQFLRSTPKS